eukprot:1814932-Prymnesium_polylepis.1
MFHQRSKSPIAQSAEVVAEHRRVAVLRDCQPRRARARGTRPPPPAINLFIFVLREGSTKARDRF